MKSTFLACALLLGSIGFAAPASANFNEWKTSPTVTTACEVQFARKYFGYIGALIQTNLMYPPYTAITVETCAANDPMRARSGLTYYYFPYEYRAKDNTMRPFFSEMHADIRRKAALRSKTIREWKAKRKYAPTHCRRGKDNYEIRGRTMTAKQRFFFTKKWGYGLQMLCESVRIKLNPKKKNSR